jgi:hypothetical protein
VSSPKRILPFNNDRFEKHTYFAAAISSITLYGVLPQKTGKNKEIGMPFLQVHKICNILDSHGQAGNHDIVDLEQAILCADDRHIQGIRALDGGILEHGGLKIVAERCFSVNGLKKSV